MKPFYTALKKYRLPILLIFGPMVVYALLWLAMGLTYEFTDAPGVLDELPPNPTQGQKVGYTINSILWVPFALNWLIGIPVGIVSGLIALVYKVVKK